MRAYIAKMIILLGMIFGSFACSNQAKIQSSGPSTVDAEEEETADRDVNANPAHKQKAEEPRVEQRQKKAAPPRSKEELFPSEKTASDPRSLNQIFCEDGPGKIVLADKDDFSNQLDLLCSAGGGSEVLTETEQNAYTGTGTPQINVLESTPNDDDSSSIVMAFSVRIPGASIDQLGKIQIHNYFAPNITNGESSMDVEVLDRKVFPGNGSIEKVRMSYTILQAAGREIEDYRETEVNIYRVVEKNPNLIMSTEHLLNAAENPYFSEAKNLVLVKKVEDNEILITTLSSVTRDNRGRHETMETALREIAAGMVLKVYEGFTR